MAGLGAKTMRVAIKGGTELSIPATGSVASLNRIEDLPVKWRKRNSLALRGV